jgi:competence protein ComEA
VREAKASGGGSRVNLNEASFDQLRGLGLSVTHATRVIAYRERRGGFESVDDLDTVPGLPDAMVGELKEQLTA